MRRFFRRPEIIFFEGCRWLDEVAARSSRHAFLLASLERQLAERENLWEAEKRGFELEAEWHRSEMELLRKEFLKAGESRDKALQSAASTEHRLVVAEKELEALRAEVELLRGSAEAERVRGDALVKEAGDLRAKNEELLSERDEARNDLEVEQEAMERVVADLDWVLRRGIGYSVAHILRSADFVRANAPVHLACRRDGLRQGCVDTRDKFCPDVPLLSLPHQYPHAREEGVEAFTKLMKYDFPFLQELRSGRLTPALLRSLLGKYESEEAVGPSGSGGRS